GALAIRDSEVVTIDPAGSLKKRGWIMSRKHLETSQLETLVANGDGALLVTGRDTYSVRDTVDPTPVLRWFSATAAGEAHTDRLSTTAAWRAAHEVGTPAPWVAIAGDTLWIVMPDVIHVRAHGAWQTIEANPQPPARFLRLYSAPLDLGYA